MPQLRFSFTDRNDGFDMAPLLLTVAMNVPRHILISICTICESSARHTSDSLFQMKAVVLLKTREGGEFSHVYECMYYAGSLGPWAPHPTMIAVLGALQGNREGGGGLHTYRGVKNITT